jgi:3-isopropylmalate/(R)-2-methylmalate dehydratase large subunit
MTITEKILARAAGKKEVSPGEIIDAKVDFAMMHDLTGPLTVESFEKIGARKVWDPARLVITFDHQTPASSIDAANNHILLREFARKHRIVHFYDMFEGICHQVLPEKGFALPGKVVIGADSHTVTYGALGCFATGVGSTDMAAILATGKIWLRVPESVKVKVEGTLKPPVMSKDLILHIIGDFGMDGATYQAVEFTGECISKMSVDGRLTICNMVVEMGAKNGIIEPDSKTLDWLRGRAKEEFEVVKSDPDAEYADERTYNAGGLEPQVACPHSVDNVKSVREVEGKKIDQAFIGTCTNGRLEDLEIAARIVKGKRVSRDVRFIVVPASTEVYRKALESGILKILVDAGALVESPGCGACMGCHVGVLGPGEVSISASNRNFRGRQGSPESEVYLASPATVAASAIEGKIADPRDHYA